MNRKSFFRGFGVGVLFTAIILGISFTVRTTDSYTISRAKQLGMEMAQPSDDATGEGDLADADENQTESGGTSGDDTLLADKTDDKEVSASEDTDSDSDTANRKDSKAELSDTDQKTSADQKTSKKSKKSDDSQDSKMDEEKEAVESDIREEMKTLTVELGDWSSDVSKKLEQLGVVESASDFDNYLNANGYGSSIRAGDYSVSPTESYEELAKQLTGK